MLDFIWNAVIVVIGVTLGTGLLVTIVGFWWTLVSTLYRYIVG